MGANSYSFLTGSWWKSEDVPASDRTDSWQAALSTGYRDWRVDKRVDVDFTAMMRQRDLGGIKFIECVCSPCTGLRSSQDIKNDDQPYVGIQLTMRGKEHILAGDNVFSFGAGDLVIWISNQASKFVVTENLHKSTLMIPLAHLKERLPPNFSLRGSIVDTKTGLGAILAAHIVSLRDQFENLGVMESAAIKRATLELVSATLIEKLASAPRGLCQRYLAAIQGYILDHLQEEDLTIGKIAQANRISVRYLHMVFEQSGRSVSSWIQNQRLERCKDVLLDPSHRQRQVSEIAYEWGFKDASHFSRSFKLHFGQSPREYRKKLPGSNDSV